MNVPPPPEASDLERIFRLKYGEPADTGWGPRQRHRFGYYTPDDHNEATIDKLVTADTDWIDVGCGRSLFPNNEPLAKELSERCRLLVGVDPDDTLDENPLVHERVKEPIDTFRTDREFDLVTMRMVAEHIADPRATAETLARLVRSGGTVVVYTVYKWSPVPLVTRLMPFGIHHPVKKLLWGTEEKDTFPVVYRMNTRSALKRHFGDAGFDEARFAYLDDCRTFNRFQFLNLCELLSRKALRAVGLRYPEVCILGLYRRV